MLNSASVKKIKIHILKQIFKKSICFFTIFKEVQTVRKYWYRRCLIIILVFTMAMGSGMLITEQQRKQEVSVESISNDSRGCACGNLYGDGRCDGSWNGEGKVGGRSKI